MGKGHRRNGVALVVVEGEADEPVIVPNDLPHLGRPWVVRCRLSDGAFAFQAVDAADGASLHFNVGHLAVFPEVKRDDHAAHFAHVGNDVVPAVLYGCDQPGIVLTVRRGFGVEALDTRFFADATVLFHFVTGQHGHALGFCDGVGPPGFRLWLGLDLGLRFLLRLGLDRVEGLGQLGFGLGFGFNRWLGFFPGLFFRLGFGWFRLGEGRIVDDAFYLRLCPLDLGFVGVVFVLFVGGLRVVVGVMIRVFGCLLGGHAGRHLEEDHGTPFFLLLLECLHVDQFRHYAGHHFLGGSEGAQQDAEDDEQMNRHRQKHGALN